MATLVLFEDEKCAQLSPLIETTPAWDLLAGTGSLAELLPQVYADTHLSASREDRTLAPGSYLFINARVLFPWRLGATVPATEENTAYFNNGDIVAAHLTLTDPYTGPIFELVQAKSAGLSHKEVAIPLAAYLWDYIYANGERIQEDAPHWDMGQHKSQPHDRASLVNPENILLSEECNIGPGVVLDASKGPIIVAKGAQVMANAVVNGPVFVGENATINPLSYIRSEVSLGAGTKVGGEITASIIMPFSNKQHHGYLGRSYIGSWCNLGTGTELSNLKNTYGPISVQLGEQKIETGKNKLGSCVGSNTTIGSNVTLAPGTVISAFCNVFGSGVIPNFLPPFTWWNAAQGGMAYDLEKALQVADYLMGKQEKQFSPTERERIRSLYAASESARQAVKA